MLDFTEEHNWRIFFYQSEVYATQAGVSVFLKKQKKALGRGICFESKL